MIRVPITHVPYANMWPPNTGGYPRQHYPMTNEWSNVRRAPDDQQLHTRQRQRMAYGSSRMCCYYVALLAGLGLTVVALVVVGVTVGLLTRPSPTSSTTTTSTTTVSTTTSTSTTTTPLICNSSCLNQSWVSTSNQVAQWLFDGNYADVTTNFNAIGNNNPAFLTNGYINQALSLNASVQQALYTSYIPLLNTSFTVDVWLFPTSYPSIKDNSIFGLCYSRSTSMCVHYTIRNISSSFRLYQGFLNNDCQSSHNVSLGQWIHAAFVFDLTTMAQRIYINGVLDGSCTAQIPIQVTIANSTIGYIPVLAGTGDTNFFQGYMDQLTISLRAKPGCEVLEDATLAARFPFNSGSALVDYGPNSATTSASSYSITSSGHSLQAISFTGSSSSYFQASGFTALGISNQPFSISLWVQPRSLSGTLVHISSSANGIGSWCAAFLGFASSGALVAQINNSSGSSVIAPGLLSLSPSWSLVVQTWSPTNGLRLYANNILVASLPSATTFAASGTTPNYVTLANSLSGRGSCSPGAIGVLSPFNGAIDELRVYSRELTTADICTMYTN